MNFYYNCSPQGYNGDKEVLTIELPSYMMEDVLTLERNIAYEKGTHPTKVLKDIINQSVNIIAEKSYERKNRKTKRR